MQEYADSFNMLIGTTDEDNDLLNSTFINFNIYRLNQDSYNDTNKPELMKDLSFRKCS
jgi:hypothetical protein